MKDAYVRYASWDGWIPRLTKLAVVVALVFLIGRLSGVAAYVFLAVALLDSYVKRPIREGRPLSSALIDPGRGPKDTAIGFGVGILMMGSVMGVLAMAGWYRVHAVTFPGLGWLLGLVVFFAAVSVVEEVLVRGFLFRFAERRAGTWVALLVSSLVFGLVHVSNPNATFIAGIALAVEAGVLLGAAMVATRSLWVPIGIHWSWNLFEGPVFGTPVSGNSFRESIIRSSIEGPVAWTGGAFGPEAGLVAVIVGTALGAIYLVMAHRRHHIVPWPRPQGPPPVSGDPAPPPAGPASPVG